MRFDYYYGAESTQFAYYQVPQILFTDPRFKGLSVTAKLLYGILQNRMSLSIKNGWFDDEGRAYIICTLEDMERFLGVSKNTCTKVVKELSTDSGVGLLERKRRGQGKPDHIYVKNFCVELDEAELPGEEPRKQVYMPEDVTEDIESQNPKNWDSENPQNEGFMQDVVDVNLESQNMGIQNPKNWDSRSSHLKSSPESQNVGIQNPKNWDSRSINFGILDSQNLSPNNIYKSNIDLNNHDVSEQEKIHCVNPFNPSINLSDLEEMPMIELNDRRTDEEFFRDTIKENIKLNLLKADALQTRDKQKLKIVEDVYEIICDMVCFRRDTVRIKGVDYPWENVKTQFLRLDYFAVGKVIMRIVDGNMQIHNMKSYLISALYEESMVSNIADQTAYIKAYQELSGGKIAAIY